MALIDGGVRSATAIAKTDCALIPINEKQFLFMVQETPFFSLTVMRTLSSVDGDVEDHGVGRSGLLLPWAPVFEFESQHTFPLRPEFPQLYATGSEQSPTRLVGRFAKRDQNRCFRVGSHPAVASRGITIQGEDQFLSDPKRHPMTGVRLCLHSRWFRTTAGKEAERQNDHPNR